MDAKRIAKMIIGVVCVVLGILALVTPLTPGSWLIFVGLELLGFELLAWHRVKRWLSRRFGKNKTEQGGDRPA